MSMPNAVRKKQSMATTTRVLSLSLSRLVDSLPLSRRHASFNPGERNRYRKVKKQRKHAQATKTIPYDWRSAKNRRFRLLHQNIPEYWRFRLLHQKNLASTNDHLGCNRTQKAPAYPGAQATGTIPYGWRSVRSWRFRFLHQKHSKVLAASVIAPKTLSLPTTILGKTERQKAAAYPGAEATGTIPYDWRSVKYWRFRLLHQKHSKELSVSVIAPKTLGQPTKS